MNQDITTANPHACVVHETPSDGDKTAEQALEKARH